MGAASLQFDDQARPAVPLERRDPRQPPCEESHGGQVLRQHPASATLDGTDSSPRDDRLLTEPLQIRYHLLTQS